MRDSDEAAAENVETVQLEMSSFTASLWPGGDIPYAFSGPLTQPEKDSIVAVMDKWEAATANTIRFNPCTVGSTCPSIYVTVRKNVAGESGGACSVGRKANALCRFAIGDSNNILHELGHCIGISHEHQRDDRDRFLDEGSYSYPTDGNHTPAALSQLPVLGNYDYDSVMHYASYAEGGGTSGTLRWKDRLGNTFSRWVSDEVSKHDASRVVQYYARDYEPAWDFFRSLATLPSGADTLPNPYLASGVKAVGTPAVAYTNGTTHVFVRGSNNGMYWKTGVGPGTWTSLGCCAGSDPAAVATNTDQIDLVFIGAESGKLLKTRYAGGAWGGWYYVEGGGPSVGIRPAVVGSGYVGPAIASRATNHMDIFVVRPDGLLSSNSYNGSWSGWHTHSSSYSVTARPAAAALSSTEVRLAITRSNAVYAPSVVYSGTTVSSFTMGASLANVVSHSAPAITKRSSSTVPFRVLGVSQAHGWLWHQMAFASNGRYIGGFPQAGTGVSAVATGSFAADIVMNGTDQLGCDTNCLSDSPNPGEVIQPGGIWLRRFE